MNALAARAMEVEAQAEITECPVALTDFLPREQYHVLVANNRQLRSRAWKLAYEIYRTMGYEPERESRMRIILQDTLPETTTFLIEAYPRLESPLATLTLVPDSPLGIPMDANCNAELNALRESGRRVCEISKLAVWERGSALGGLDHMILFPLFQLAWLKASRLCNATDLVIVVHPHHARFYEKVLLFQPIGPVRECGSVSGTPGIPLRLDLTTAEERYAAKYGFRSGNRNLYRMFLSGNRPAILDWMDAVHCPMTEDEFRYFFVEQSDRLAGTTVGERFHLRRGYPDFDFDRMLSTGETETWMPASARPRLCEI